jgi:hypothetical protein
MTLGITCALTNQSVTAEALMFHCMPATPDNTLMQVQKLQDALPDHTSISLASVFRFMSLAERIQNDIILVQLGNYDSSSPPDNLSDGLIQFLAATCNISEVEVPTYWSMLKSAVWAGFMHQQANDVVLFSSHGYKYGIRVR